MTTKVSKRRSAFGALTKGTQSRVPVLQASPGDTLLAYAIATDPSPAQAGANATLYLDVSNSTRGTIECSRIVVAFQTGNSCMQQDRRCRPSGGEAGGNGGDAYLQITLPGLDTTSPPRRVIPIVLTGGPGGPGGDGGGVFSVYDQISGFPGGRGGNGGNAVLDLTLDATGPARAQYIIRLTGGPGAAGGQGGAPYARAGAAGSSGGTSMTVTQRG